MIDAAFIDKSTWGDGPWQTEPDRKEWTDAATGLPCLAIRVSHHGSWCGYVGVPPTHPAYGLSYNGIPDETHEKEREATQAAISKCGGDLSSVEWPARTEPVGAGLAVLDIDVHGGLTYAAACEGHICHVPVEGEPDNIWWFGFDSAHAFDYAPAMAALTRGMGMDRRHDDEVYRDLPYVEGECRSLARQLAAINVGDVSVEN